MSGVVVSNHGGRQVDGAIAMLDALSGVVDAVAGRIPVILDGGVRSPSRSAPPRSGSAAPTCGVSWRGGRARGHPQLPSRRFDLTMGLAGLISAREIGRDNVTRV